MADIKGTREFRVIVLIAVGAFLVWILCALLPLIALTSSWFRVKEVDHAKSVLSQLGTYGDMFGMVNCLFSGAAMIGVVYAVLLQRRQLHHQQEEIDQSRRDREAGEKAREQELKDSAAWQRRTAMLNATNFLAQTYAAKLVSIPAEIISPADHERLKDRQQQRVETEQRLEEFIVVLANLLEQFSKEHTNALRADQAGKAFDDLLKAADSVLAGGKPESP
jgi:hypothetical protein